MNSNSSWDPGPPPPPFCCCCRPCPFLTRGTDWCASRAMEGTGGERECGVGEDTMQKTNILLCNCVKYARLKLHT